MLTVRDLVNNYEFDYIEFREFDTDGDDVLYGYCKYDKATDTLIPEDGDIYGLDEYIIGFEIIADKDNNKCLTLWTSSEWVTYDPQFEVTETKTIIESKYDAQQIKKKD